MSKVTAIDKEIGFKEMTLTLKTVEYHSWLDIKENKVFNRNKNKGKGIIIFNYF